MMVVLRGSGTARRRILAILVGTIAVAVAAGGTAWAESPWSIVASPNAGSSAELVAVDSKASGDAWAVGDTFDVTTSSYRTLAERWNGSVWSVVPAVNPKANNWLTGVTSVSATNAWAVGFATNGTWATNRTVIERWNGTSWGVVPSPS